jgi:hypothetical protein
MTLIEVLADSTMSRHDQEAYVGVLVDAAIVHVDRERIRRAMWKDYKPIDQIRQIVHKADRCMRILEMSDEVTHEEAESIYEECMDFINYATFAARQIRKEA